MSGIALFLGCLAACLFGATHCDAVIVLTPSPPDETAIDWDGIDAMDGDGTVSFFDLGDTISVTLRVLCNQKAGYKLYLHSNNATAANESWLKKGTDQIRYTALMDVSGVLDARIATNSLDLLNGSTASLDVTFKRRNDVIPLDGNTEANEIRLDLTLDSSQGVLHPMGVYSDVITATVAIN